MHRLRRRNLRPEKMKRSFSSQPKLRHKRAPMLDTLIPRKRGWDAEIEAYVVKRMRKEPKISIKQLHKELRDSFGYSAVFVSLRSSLRRKVYKKHEDIRILRTPEPSAAIPKIKKIINMAISSNRYENEIVPHLTEREKTVIENMFFTLQPPRIKDVAESSGIPNYSVYTNLYKILKKLQNWEQGKRMRVHGGKYSFVEPLRISIEKRISNGEGLDEIKRVAKLNKVQQHIIDIYVMAKERPSLSEISDRLQVSRGSIGVAVRSIKNKLLGKLSRDHEKNKFLSMSDKELKSAIMRVGAKSRSALQGKNYGLYLGARERGVLDDMFPRKKSEVLKKLRIAVRMHLRKKSLDDMLAGLMPVERDIITKIVLASRPERIPYFKMTYGVADNQALKSLENMLFRKLKGLRTKGNTPSMMALRNTMTNIENDGMVELRGRLSEMEREIIDRRILAEVPETLDELGSRLGVTRERIRQLEKNLLMKFKHYLATGNLPKSRKKGRKKKYDMHSDQAILVLAKGYIGRSDCYKMDYTLIKELKKRGLMDKAFGPEKYSRRKGKYASSSDEELLIKSKQYSGRTECFRENSSIFRELKKRGLMYKAFGLTKRIYLATEYSSISNLSDLELQSVHQAVQQELEKRAGDGSDDKK